VRLIRIALGGSDVIAEGDPGDPADRDRLSAAFEEELASGTFALVPCGLDLCCRRGLQVGDFSEVPLTAPRVTFLQRPA
jgi:hypothetical protein